MPTQFQKSKKSDDCNVYIEENNLKYKENLTFSIVNTKKPVRFRLCDFPNLCIRKLTEVHELTPTQKQHLKKQSKYKKRHFMVFITKRILTRYQNTIFVS